MRRAVPKGRYPLENLALRHQLAVYKRTGTRPRLRRTDRLFWVAVATVSAGWKQSLVTANEAGMISFRRRCQTIRHHRANLYYQTEEAMEGRNAFVEKRAVDFKKFRR